MSCRGSYDCNGVVIGSGVMAVVVIVVGCAGGGGGPGFSGCRALSGNGLGDT